jgi:hypothetical protein
VGDIMSTIKLTGTSSGSSIIKAPDSGSTNQTFTLPASSGTLVTTTDAGVAGITSAADATAITIDSAENVGFGVTPTSFYSGYTGVQVGGNGTFYGQTAAGASNNFWVGQNVRAGTDGSEKAITTGVSSQMMQSSGAIVFKTGASASADANVSWTNVLDIKADGRGLSQFTAKVWGILDGNTNNIKDSHNVSSITDHGAGDYTFNFTNNLASSTFCTTSSFSRTHWDNFVSIYGGHQTAGSVRVTHNRTSTTGGIDTDQLCIQVFGD